MIRNLVKIKDTNTQFTQKYKLNYSSPIRYIYSILNNEIPLTNDEFEDNLGKIISLQVGKDVVYKNIFNNYFVNIKSINNKISLYNSYIEKDYSQAILKIKKLLKS